MRRRSGLGILLVFCILTGMLLEPAEQVQAKKKLSDYSTKTYCWGLGQNTRHQKSGRIRAERMEVKEI